MRTIWNDMERYGTIWNDMELERSGTFVNVRRTFRQESYERPYLYMHNYYIYSVLIYIEFLRVSYTHIVLAALLYYNVSL
jgi:hypothetical protein